MATGSDSFVVDFPTLWVALDWIEAHCVIPDRARKGQPFVMYDWQLWCAANHYRVRPDALPVGSLREDGTEVSGASAFFFRRSQIDAPQKTGKGPFTASIVMLEALGPALFAGWAEEGDVYRCADHRCDCGWEYEYQAGEPMGTPQPTPLIQLTAASEDQTDNVYGPLKAMFRYGAASGMVTVGEEFTRLPNDGKVETVTSSALSRLGNPVNFVAQDETQLYSDSNKLRKVGEGTRRNAAGMGGRSMETTNPWDPSEDSVAQRTYESKRPDIFKFYRNPDNVPELHRADGKPYKFTVARERRKILEYVYRGSSHVDLNSIEAEALELMEKDPGQAERFYGNRIVAGLGHWCSPEAWGERGVERVVPKGTQIVLGFDGSDRDDWTGFRAETQDGFQFTPSTSGGLTIWNPAEYGNQVPRLAVAEALDELMTTYDVVRLYADPPYWQTEIDTWAAKYGEKRVISWYTQAAVKMWAACERLLTDVVKAESGFTHDGCEFTSDHIGAARKKTPPTNPSGRYGLAKPGDGRKIDLAVCSVLCHEAAGDVTAAKLWRKKHYVYSA